jgi:hypothetical protein
MNYSSARSFRQALEDRLRTNYPQHEIPRLRKMIAFERFMARLDEQWILKGGYALQLRTDRARTTQDIDLLAQQISQAQIAETLLEKAHEDRGDYFEFFIERTDLALTLGTAVRFRVITRLAGRDFERFHIDIGYGDPIVEPVEYLMPPTYLDFAGIDPTPIPCYPVSQHIAEKFHALVRPRPVESSRVKDLVDILLFAGMDSELQAKRLYAAIQSVFDAYEDIVPEHLGQIPAEWRPKYNQFTKNFDLPFSDFDVAVQAVQSFINPILEGRGEGIWNPESWQWKSDFADNS